MTDPIQNLIDVAKTQLCRSDCLEPGVGCCKPNLVEAIRAATNAQQPWQVPTGHTYLPKITPEMFEEFGDTCLMTWHNGPQWTQTAVDFTCIIPVKLPTAVIDDAMQEQADERKPETL